LARSGGNVRLARRFCALADSDAELHISRERRGVSAGVARECFNRQPQLRDKTGIFLRRQRTVRTARQQMDGGVRAGSPQA
jgi:hypothetical protein